MRNTKVFDTKQEKYLTIKIRPLMDGNIFWDMLWDIAYN